MEAITDDFLARLHAFIRRRVRSDADADDLLQDVLVKLVERGEEVRSVPAWLFAVARRAIIDRHRAKTGDGPLVGEIAAEEAVETAARELARCMEPLLAGLPAEERALLERVDMAGESQAEIARSLGLSRSTVKSRVQRARARLLGRLTDCCAVALDARGGPLEAIRRPGRPCECGDGSCAPD